MAATSVGILDLLFASDLLALGLNNNGTRDNIYPMNMMQPTNLMKGKSPPLSRQTKMMPPKTMPKKFNFTMMFLLGVVGCKWWIDHQRRRIRIYLPESKRYLAQFLQQHLGGTVSTVRRAEHTGVMWQTANGATITAIKKAAKKYSSWLPSELVVQFERFTQAQGLS